MQSTGVTWRPVATVAWSVCLYVCVCLLVTTVSPANTDEPIDTPFGQGQTHVGSRSDVFTLVGGALWHHPANAMDRSVWQRRGVLSLPLLQQLIIGTWQS